MLKITAKMKTPHRSPYSLCVREKNGNCSMKILDIKISFPAIGNTVNTAGHFLGRLCSPQKWGW